MRLVCPFVALVFVAACQPAEVLPARPAAVGAQRYLVPLDDGPTLLARLCSSGNHDRVTRYFCASPTPSPTSLVELERGLGLDPATAHFALTANSTAVTIREVNPINPRAILFDGVPRAYPRTGEFLALGFTRGEQLVELATRDELSHELRFFIVEFKQGCNETGCTLEDLLTPRLERDWTTLRVMQDVDLANTVVDCLRCHQPAGPTTNRLLRMQEFSAPWAHFLASATDNPAAGALVSDFRSAHPASEVWAGIPGTRLEKGSEPGMLSSLVAQESTSQPNEFNSFAINLELQYGNHSSTWDGIAETARRGDAIPVPFFGLRVTHSDRQAEVAARYRQVLAGDTSAPLLDTRTLQTEEAERAMSVRPTVGATGRQMLEQLCQHCHHSKLDQSLSRSRFDVQRLDAMPAAERALAIERLKLPADDVKKMPPIITGELTPEELELAEAALR